MLCDSPEPVRRDPLRFSDDVARRDCMLHFYLESDGQRYAGGAASFDNLDSARLWAYVISRDRPDDRTSLQTVYADGIDAQLRADGARFCVDDVRRDQRRLGDSDQ